MPLMLYPKSATIFENFLSKRLQLQKKEEEKENLLKSSGAMYTKQGTQQTT